MRCDLTVESEEGAARCFDLIIPAAENDINTLWARPWNYYIPSAEEEFTGIGLLFEVHMIHLKVKKGFLLQGMVLEKCRIFR